jgi:N6-adenosine-specific RNA methylase IME4
MEWPTKKYRVIVVDPPWDVKTTYGDFERKASIEKKQAPYKVKIQTPYKMLKYHEIFNLKIKDIADKNCYIWIWCTNSKQKNGVPTLLLAFELLKAWGFKYSNLITWDKIDIGSIYAIYRNITEFALFGYKGAYKQPGVKISQLKNCFSCRPEGHSIKPQVFYDEIRTIFPGPRVEIFAREKRPGFDGWGDEYGTKPITRRELLSRSINRYLAHKAFNPNQLPLPIIKE